MTTETGMYAESRHPDECWERRHARRGVRPWDERSPGARVRQHLPDEPAEPEPEAVAGRSPSASRTRDRLTPRRRTATTGCA